MSWEGFLRWNLRSRHVVVSRTAAKCQNQYRFCLGQATCPCSLRGNVECVGTLLKRGPHDRQITVRYMFAVIAAYEYPGKSRASWLGIPSLPWSWQIGYRPSTLKSKKEKNILNTKTPEARHKQKRGTIDKVHPPRLWLLHLSRSISSVGFLP